MDDSHFVQQQKKLMLNYRSKKQRKQEYSDYIKEKLKPEKGEQPQDIDMETVEAFKAIQAVKDFVDEEARQKHDFLAGQLQILNKLLQLNLNFPQLANLMTNPPDLGQIPLWIDLKTDKQHEPIFGDQYARVLTQNPFNWAGYLKRGAAPVLPTPLSDASAVSLRL